MTEAEMIAQVERLYDPDRLAEPFIQYNDLTKEISLDGKFTAAQLRIIADRLSAEAPK